MASKVSGLLAIFLVLVGVFQGLEARANPEADAEPEAEADPEANPDADPDAQYGSGSYVDVADENGGQGYYPGDQNGGQGYYPGGGSYPPNPGMPGGQGYNPGLSGGQGYNPGGGQGYSPGGSTCPRDQFCGMDTENCCLGGQKCFNYYEQVCENVRLL